MNITTKFDLRQRVFIPELKLPGKVIGFYMTHPDTMKYEVRYFDKSTATSAYFYEEELSDVLPAKAQEISINPKST